MAAQNPANGHDALEETLSRVTKKAGVKATIVLDRATGTVLKTSGQVSSIRVSKPLNPAAAAPAPSAGSFAADSDVALSNESQGVDDLAALVWNFVSSAGAFVQDIDSEDELKLLRLRTKKQELVIVPDAKYLLVVIHDTPPA